MPGLSWILNLLYALLVLFFSPVIVYRMIVQGKYRDGWKEKLLGRLPISPGTEPRIWFHAVSVGEVLQLRPVLERWARIRPDDRLIVTTTTVTGHALARKTFPRATVCYCPLDFSWAVRRAVHRVRPSLLVLVELELWPNLIRAAARNGVQLALINARVSDHSFRGYRRIRLLMRPLLRCFALLAAQDEHYADRLEELGAPRNRLRVTGSIKFDGVTTDRSNPRTAQLRKVFGIAEGERVFVAGSTHAPEEEQVLDAWCAARKHYSDLRLILVPRHAERFDEVARLVLSRNLPLLRRTEVTQQSEDESAPGQASNTDHSIHPPVLLLDTLGELSACWGLADIAFVGGSLTGRGGQNMIEPAGYGAAVLFGPNTANFCDVVDQLLDRHAARVVHNRQELTRAVRFFLERPDVLVEQGERARRVVVSGRGATDRTIELLDHLLSVSCAHISSRAA